MAGCLSGERTPPSPSLPPGVAVGVRNLTKVYRLYDSPRDRLKEAIHPFRKVYHKEFHALSDVSFEIGKGEAVGIIGRNGSGKSTLLKIVTGVLTPTRGSVAVNGKVSALLELGTGFHPEFTGMENIFFSGTIMGYTRAEMETKLDDIVGFADIGEYIHQPVRTYSSGMYVRLAFAVAINVDPEILVVDEVLAVGDIAFQNRCLRMISRFAESGDKTILFVTHDMNALRLLCHRALLFEKGRLRMDGSPAGVIDRYAGSVFDAPSFRGSGVLRAGIADRSGIFVEALPCRSACSLVIELNDLVVEKGLLLAFRFVNLENKFSYRIETDKFQSLTGTIRGKKLVADFEELNLPKGRYSVNISVSDGSYINRVHHVDEAVSFAVTEETALRPFLKPEWREGAAKGGRIGLIGWWGGENEGDRYMLEVLARALGDRFDVHAIRMPFDITDAALGRLNALDGIIVGGGGLFTCTPPKPLDTFPRWKSRLKTPFGVLGIGIQEIGSGHEDAIRDLIDASADFVVRDRESLDLAGRFSPRAAKAPDLTFLYPRKVERVQGASSIGVNLRVWDFDEERSCDNRAWCEAINALPGEKETIPLSSLESLDDAEAMTGIEGRRHAAFDIGLYRNIRIMVGMRLHSLIFAAQNGIPVIGIAYTPKVRRFMRGVGLENFCLDVREWGRLRGVFDEALKREREISDILLRYTERSRMEIHRALESMRLLAIGRTKVRNGHQDAPAAGRDPAKSPGYPPP